MALGDTISRTYERSFGVERELTLPLACLVLNMLGGGKLILSGIYAVRGVICRADARWKGVRLLSPPALLPGPVLSRLLPADCVKDGGITVPMLG